jgi:hypothetical protein
MLLHFIAIRWKLIEWGSLLNSTRTRLAIGTLSSTVRTSIAYFNAVIKINYLHIARELYIVEITQSQQFHNAETYLPSLVTDNR